MKIEYNLTKKEFRHFLNIALGIMHNKKRFLKHQKIYSYTDICFKNLFLVLLIIPFINFLDTFKETEIISVMLIFILFFILLVSGLYIIIGLKYISMCEVVLKGQIEFLKDEIVSISAKGRISKKSWKYIDFIVILEEVILIFSKEKAVFLIPNTTNNKETLLKVIEAYEINVDLYDISMKNISFLKKGLVYGLIFLLLISISIKWDNYNKKILEKASNNYLDTNNLAYGKYAILEKEIKYYHLNWQNNYDIYLDNSALNTFNILTIDFLTNHKAELKNILNDLSNKKDKANLALNELVNLTDEKYLLHHIKIYNLGNYYDNLYKKYTLNMVKESKEEWSKNLEINNKNNDYLKDILTILLKDNNLYFYNESDLTEYNHLYDLITSTKKEVKF